MSTSINDEHFRNTLYSWPEMGLILLYENFYWRLLRIADIYTRDRQSSEDVVQEVFLDIWRRHKQVGAKRGEPLERYLVKAVQYSSIVHYKKRVKSQKREKEYYYSNFSAVDDDALERRPINDQGLMKLIAETFPSRERECLLLRMDGVPIEDIARKLGVTKKAVERSLTSARKRFKRFGARFYDLFF